MIGLSRSVRIIGPLFVLVLAVATGGADLRASEPARTTPAATTRETAKRILSDPRYQKTRPDGTLRSERPPQPDRLPRAPRTPPRFEPRQASGISEVILWVVGGIFATGLVLVLARELAMVRRRRRKKRGKADGTFEEMIVEVARMNLPASLQRARELAAAGRFEEAAHVLLMSAMGYLHALAGFSLEPAYTSREVLERAPLEPRLRASLGELVGVVEISLFGGLPVDAEDFARCERSFLVLHDRLGHGE